MPKNGKNKYKKKIKKSYKDNGQVNKDTFFFKKKFGQNFLKDSLVLDKIIEAANLSTTSDVVEIGPGMGALTERLAQQAGRVLAIEIDQQLIPLLEEKFSDSQKVTILNQDFMTWPMEQGLSEHGFDRKVAVVANLPYYITSPIVMKLLEAKHCFDPIVIMVQKEVAERMQAKPGTKEYGVLSVFVQYYCQPTIVCHVSAEAFYPPPKVDSAVICLRPVEELLEKDDKRWFIKIVKGVFANRRKTLVNSLSGQKLAGVTKPLILEALKRMDLPATIRGEKLTLEELIKLAKYLQVDADKEIAIVEKMRKIKE